MTTRRKAAEGKLGPRRVLPFTREQVKLFEDMLGQDESSTGKRDLALMRVAVDTALRSVDVVNISVGTVLANGFIVEEFEVIQKKTKHPVRCFLSPRTQKAVVDWIAEAGLTNNPNAKLFNITTRQFQRIVKQLCNRCGLDHTKHSTHSFRRTKSTIIYNETGDTSAISEFLGTKSGCIDPYTPSMTRDEARAIARQFDI